jgi:transcriptional regulator with XRE-family HTH domain
VREDATPASFGKILRRYRSVSGLTQEELARLSGLSVRAISDIERGRTSRPYGRTIRLLADALKLDEPARAGLMNAVYEDVEEAAGDRQEWIAGWEQAATSTTTMSGVIDASAVAAPGRRASRTWRHPRRARWAPLAAAAVAALAGTVMGRAMVNHAQTSPQAISRPQRTPQKALVSSAYPAVATCGQEGTVDLASSLVHGTNGLFWGTVEVRYSYRCAAAWTLFDPSPAVSDTKAVTVTLKLVRLPGENYRSSRGSGTYDGQSTNLLPLRNGCAQGSVILMKLGRELASATTPCQAPP